MDSWSKSSFKYKVISKSFVNEVGFSLFAVDISYSGLQVASYVFLYCLQGRLASFLLSLCRRKVESACFVSFYFACERTSLLSQTFMNDTSK